MKAAGTPTGKPAGHAPAKSSTRFPGKPAARGPVHPEGRGQRPFPAEAGGAARPALGKDLRKDPRRN
ncbi:hypothetical protein, partial [Roseomonas mucosa]|uniref:hypothetical protein n=1 Tax=Roseomonas mucosa TaxID=207340 RepID=UPI0039EE7F29